jgi:type VI secretion system protein ImpC
VELDVTFSRRREESDPLRLLVLGDFSGKPADQRPPLATRPTLAVDVDTLDPVMQRIAPRVRLAAGELAFSTIDDFHPDRLFARVDRFKALLEARANPSASAGGDLLGPLLGRSSAEEPATPVRPASGLDALIHDIVAPHIVKDRTAESRPVVAAIEAVLSEELRALLHAPQFQAMEAAWRGVHWLVSHLELNEDLQLHLFDVAQDELIADVVAAGGQIHETGLYRALVDRWRNVPGGQGWSVIATLMQFGPSDRDIGLLAALGVVATQAGGPVIGGADWSLIDGDDGTLQGWNALRHSEVARWIALAAPRVLLRRPYGKRTDPIDTVPFEEIDGPPLPGALLWGSPALALTLLIGAGFSARGWKMELGDERELEDLPAYSYVAEGEMQMQPVGERLLSERGIEQLLNAGVVPIASRRDRNAAVAIRFQSIADPAAPLAWS